MWEKWIQKGFVYIVIGVMLGAGAVSALNISSSLSLGQMDQNYYLYTRSIEKGNIKPQIDDELQVSNRNEKSDAIEVFIAKKQDNINAILHHLNHSNDTRMPILESDNITRNWPLDPIHGNKRWHTPNWKYRKLITINHTKLHSPLTNFPILVYLPYDNDIASKAQDDGDDICFFVDSDNTTKLNHEMEWFNGTSGKLSTWVTIPLLSNISDIRIWMYYGNGTCENQQNPTGVWDEGYVGVWHKREDTNTQTNDSTSNARHGAFQGTLPQTVSGQVGDAQEYDGVSGYVSLPVLESFNAFTLSVWIKPDSTTANRHIFSNDAGTNWRNTVHMSNWYTRRSGSATRDDLALPSLSTGLWTFLTFVYDGTGALDVKTIYKDGVSAVIKSPTAHGAGNIGADIDKSWFGYGGDGLYFDGVIDEVRVSSVIRNVSWINATYQTIADPSTFFSIGPEEQLFNNPPYEPTNPAPTDGATDIPVTIDLHWIGGDPDPGDIVTYDVYFGSSFPITKIAANISTAWYPLVDLLYNTKYYWQVIAWDNHQYSNASSIWLFTTTNETNPPTVKIITPQKGYLYINLGEVYVRKSLIFITTLIIGKIEVTVTATDTESGIERVEFYIDDQLKATDTTEPYTWIWQERGYFFPYQLSVKAYDNMGNMNREEIKVWKIL